MQARKTGCRAVASRDASGGPLPRHRPLPAGDQRLNPVVDGDRRLPLRLVAVLAQAEGQRPRRLGPGSLRVSRTRGRRDRGERDSRPAAGDAGRLSCRACGEQPVPAVGAMASRARPDPRPGCRPPRASTGTLTRCLPAGHEGVVRALLCITMWITCVKRCRACAHIRKCWGFRCRAAPVTGPSPGRARSAPCGRRRKRNCPHATPQ